MKTTDEEMEEAAGTLVGLEFVGPVAELAQQRIAKALAVARDAGAREQWTRSVLRLRQWAELVRPDPDVWKAIGELENLREDEWPWPEGL